MRTIISLIQALLFLVASLSVPDSNFKVWVDRAAVDMSSTSQISFDSIDAGESQVSQSDKDACREWYEENILTTEKPAYTFSVGYLDFRRNINKWEFSFSEESEKGEVYRGGKTTYITIRHKKSDIVATVEATIYEDNASCDWTVYLKNTGDKKSPVVSEFYALDSTVPTGRKTEAYFNYGSFAEADDFKFMKSKLAVLPMNFSANGGRTESFLPYFNLVGKGGGVVLAVGWSGQWFTSMRQAISGAKIEAKQETFKGYLLPDEEVRSPMVSLTFYESDNALKGFNTFREYVIDCVSPEDVGQVTTTGIGVEAPGATEESVINGIKGIPEEWAASLDYGWVDAGWYPMKENWSNDLGNWYADPAKFPNGFAPVADALAEKGMGLLLWYEIERCCKDSMVYNECIKNDGWIIVNEEDTYTNYVNFANEGCLEYMTDMMVESLRFNKVSCLRNDHNYALLPFWEQADKLWADNRKGITENHYVTNLYRFFDTLREEIPGLTIDNCASGGKRLDIEMARRSIPLWRSDYNCMDGEGNSKPDILQATQSQTFGLSFWYPYNGTCAYLKGEYADRTNIISCSQILDYYNIRKYMTGNYYPLTYGGLDTEKYLAMQFDTDAQEGVALIYKREDVKSSTYHLLLNGLDRSKVYEVYDYDIPEVKKEYSGAQLMDEGINLTINDTPKAVIMMYKVK